MNKEKKQADKDLLWKEYWEHPSDDLREKIILAYADLVKIVAGRLNIYLGNNVEYDDLVGYGVFGLIDAIDRYDPSKDVKFETYASFRIRGAILDQIRKMDWIPRTVRQRQRKLDDAARKVESKTGHSATDEELSQELGISREDLAGWQAELNVTNLISLDDFMEQGAEPQGDSAGNSQFIQPEEQISKEELTQKLSEALSLLTEKERRVVLLYYYEDLTLKEISEIMEVSESRVSQLHSKALKKMRKTLGDYMGILINS